MRTPTRYRHAAALAPATRATAMATAGLLLIGCSGSGGGGSAPTPAPIIVGATLLTTGATAAAGDSLTLLMSRDIALTGALLTDEDIALSAGSLGSVTLAPSLINARAVRIRLGAGVDLTAGVTTIDFDLLNDAVAGTDGALAEPSAPQTILGGDGSEPTISQLTLNDIQDPINGTGPAAGTLQVPPNGFVIDLDYDDPSSPIATALTQISFDVDVTGPSGVIAAGSDVSSELSLTATGNHSAFTVPAGVQLPTGPVTVTAVVVDTSGMSSVPAQFSFRTTSVNDGIRPMESGQTWFLDTSRDIESFSFAAGGGGTPPAINIIDGANGTPDIEDLYAIIGLFGSDSGVNSTVADQLETELLQRLGEIFSGVAVTFTTTSPGPFASTTTGSVPYASFGFSQMCIAGAYEAAGSGGVLGLAIFDESNETQDDDCLVDFSGQRLGVFMHTLAHGGVRSGAASTFRTTYDDLMPGFGGTPIGDDPQDASRLAGTLQDARATTIDTAILRFARSISVITAHECGHSMGLVKDGAMPTGLYGGDSTNFPGSSGGHIDNDPLFSGFSQNVMSPRISFEGSINLNSGLNRLNHAYLRERVLYDND